MAAATHVGSCQACGHGQKLPGGRLAKHGYAVLWSSFVGTCPGSGRLPFEVSCDYIAAHLDYLRGSLAHLQAFHAELLTPATTPQAWYHKRIPATWDRGNRHGGYVWTLVDIVAPPTGLAIVLDGKPSNASSRGLNYSYTNDPLVLATSMNKSRADAVQAEIEQTEKFIAWQEDRVRTWHPVALTPVPVTR